MEWNLLAQGCLLNVPSLPAVRNLLPWLRPLASAAISGADGAQQGALVTANWLQLAHVGITTGCGTVLALQGSECSFHVSGNWPSAGLQAGPGYLYYQQLIDGLSSAQDINITCPLADWPATLAAAGTTLSPCAATTVASGDELLAVLDALQPAYERVFITLTANTTLQRRGASAGPLALVRNVTIVGGMGGRATELNLQGQTDALELPAAPAGSCLHIADLSLVNLPAGEPTTWPVGLLPTLQWFFVRLDQPPLGAAAAPRMFGLRVTQVLHPSTTQYLDYWTSRQASAYVEERHQAAWLDPLITGTALVQGEDGAATTQRTFGTNRVGYAFAYASGPLLTPPSMPAVDLWDLGSPPVALTDVRVLGATATATAAGAEGVGRQLLQELQAASPLARTLLLAANASLSVLWWPPSALIALAAPVTLAGPSAWPVMLDAGGVALQTAGGALTLKSLVLAGLRPPAAATAAGQLQLRAPGGASGAAGALHDWREVCGPEQDATAAGGMAVAGLAAPQAVRCVVLLPSGMVSAMYRVAADGGADGGTQPPLAPAEAFTRSLLVPPQAVVGISPQLCAVPGTVQLAGLGLTNCTLVAASGNNGANSTTTTATTPCTYAGLWSAMQQQTTAPPADGDGGSSSQPSSLSTSAVVGLAVMGAFCGLCILVGAAFGARLLVRRRQRRRDAAAVAGVHVELKPPAGQDAHDAGGSGGAGDVEGGGAAAPGAASPFAGSAPAARSAFGSSLAAATAHDAVAIELGESKAGLRVMDLATAAHRVEQPSRLPLPGVAPAAALADATPEGGVTPLLGLTGSGTESAGHKPTDQHHHEHRTRDYRERLGSLIDNMRTVLQQQQQLQPSKQLLQPLRQQQQQGPGGEVQLQMVVGQGSYGVVLKGLWRGLEVAVKVVLLPACAGQLQRRRHLLAEVDNSTRLSHPNIVAVYAFQIHQLTPGQPYKSRLLQTDLALSPAFTAERELLETDGGAPASASRRPAWEACLADPESDYKLAIIMQYCEGGNLADAIQGGQFKLEDGSPDMVSVLLACNDIASGLVYLHARGIVHLDLKSANVLLKRVLLPAGGQQQQQPRGRKLSSPLQPQQPMLQLAGGPPSPQRQQTPVPAFLMATAPALCGEASNSTPAATAVLLPPPPTALSPAPVQPALVSEGPEPCTPPPADAPPLSAQRQQAQQQRPARAAAPTFICKLADFGMSLDLSSSSSSSSERGPHGTRLYSAPEQLVGQLSPACDVYSLGLVLWELVNGMTLRALYSADLAVPAHPGAEALLARMPACVPEGVRALMAACLAADPAQRPSARQAQQELQAVVRALVGEAQSMVLLLGDSRAEGDTGKVV